MPPDHLTLTDPDLLLERVEALIFGGTFGDDSDEAAAADLTGAVATYRNGGRAALQRRAEQSCFHAHVTPPDWATAETHFATTLGPRLDHLGNHSGWWFLRKHPYWRIRVHTSDHTPTAQLLNELLTEHVIRGWQAGIYEPETAAFGGTIGINIVHGLFSADSRGVLSYARHDSTKVGRRELSLLLIRAMQHHAGLDLFEAGDVFARVAELRPLPADTDICRIDSMAATMRPMLAVPAHATSALLSELGLHGDAAIWLTGFCDAGRKLGGAAAIGQLGRGLRNVLGQIVIFHWNRLGLPVRTQSILAHAARNAILPTGN